MHSAARVSNADCLAVLLSHESLSKPNEISKESDKSNFFHFAFLLASKPFFFCLFFCLFRARRKNKLRSERKKKPGQRDATTPFRPHCVAGRRLQHCIFIFSDFVWEFVTNTTTMFTSFLLLLYLLMVSSFNIPNYEKLSRTCPSQKVNAWNLKIGSKMYLITPAHVAVYSKENKWVVSDFLSDLRHLDWKIPVDYKNSPEPAFDICWTDGDDDATDFISLDISSFTHLPASIDLYFRQPYDLSGKWVAAPGNLGVKNAVLYSTPDDTKKDQPLFEALDVGFRGMSGAVGLRHDTTELVGMFVKRGALIQLKSQKNMQDKRLTNKGEQARDLGVLPRLNKEYSPVQRFFRSLLGLDDMESKFDSKFDYLDRKFDSKFDDLAEIVLCKADLKELGAVFDARRGIFLSAAAIHSLIQGDYIHLNQLENCPAPTIDSQ